MWEKVVKKMKEKIRKGEPVRFSLFFNFLTGRLELGDDDTRKDDDKSKPGESEGRQGHKGSD